MKVLSDFDGVMTDQIEEALYHRRVIRDKIISVGEVPHEQMLAWWDAAKAEVQAHPERHGWRSEGRLAVYSDEDHFMENVGFAECLDGWARDGHKGLQGILARLAGEAGIESFVGVGRWAMEETVRNTREGKIQPMDPVVGEAIRGLLNADVDLVVVSNSSTERIVELLRSVGLEPASHEEEPHARLRVRGGARKFDLGEEADVFDLGERSFDANRPRYRAILDEERPHVVIGDVFSLDLATPLFLSRTDPEVHGGMTLLLRERSYTPTWAREIVTADGEMHARMGVLSSFGELQGAVPGLLPPSCRV